MRTGHRHINQTSKAITRIVTPEVFTLLSIGLYIIHFYLYPEAIEYLYHALTPKTANQIADLDKVGDYPLIMSLLDQHRMAYAIIESSFGILRCFLISTLLFAGALYLQQRLRSIALRYSLISAIVGFAISCVFYLTFYVTTISYPSRSGLVAFEIWLQMGAMTFYIIATGLLFAKSIQFLYSKFHER